MQIRGTTTSRVKTKEEEEREKKNGGTKTKPATTTKPTTTTKPKTTPKPKMTAAKAEAQQSRVNTRTNPTRTQLTDGPSSRKPKQQPTKKTQPLLDTRRTDPMTRMRTGSYQKENGIRKPKEQTKAQAAAGVAKGLAGLAKNDAKRAEKAIGDRVQRATKLTQETTQKSRAYQQQDERANAKRKERKKQIEYEMAQLRTMIDDEKAEKAVSGLPKKVVDLLDRYNQTADAVSEARSAGGNADISTYMTMKNQMDNIAKRLTDAGYKNYKELAEYRQRLVDKAETEQIEQRMTQFGQEHPVLGAAGARLITPVAAAVTAAQNVKDALQSGNARTMNTYSAGWVPTRAKNALDQGVQNNFNDGFLSQGTKSFLYQTAMSGLDSLMMAPLTGGEVLLGLGAANDAILQASERGATKGQALLSGLASGVAESLFEHVSIGNLKAMKEVPVHTVKDALMNFAKSAAVNFSEEAATEVANIITDQWINGGNSDYYNAVMDGVINKGLSPAAAKREASKQMGLRVAEAGLGGALMGGAFAGIGTASGEISNNRAMQQAGAQIAAQDGGRERLTAGARDALANGALDEKQRSKTEKLAGQVEAAAGAQQSRRQTRRDNRRMGELAALVDEATGNDAAGIVAQEARQRLLELGETGDADAVAQAIGETVTGTAKSEKAAKQAQETIGKSKFGTRVLNEVGDMTGQFSSDWTQQMDDRLRDLNARRYEGKTQQVGENGAAPSGRDGGNGETPSTTRQGARSPFPNAPDGVGDGKEAAGTQGQLSEGLSERAQEMAQAKLENAQLKGVDVEPTLFYKEFSDAYRWGKEGKVTREAVEQSEWLSGIPVETVRSAYRLGAEERAQEAPSGRGGSSDVASPVSTQERAATFLPAGSVGASAQSAEVATGNPRPASGEGKEAAGVQERGAQAKTEIVRGIQAVQKDGEVIVTLQDGSAAKASEVNMDNTTRWAVTEAANYDAQTAEAFFQGSVQASSQSGYRDAFRAFYGAGRLGSMSFDDYRATAEGRVMAGKMPAEVARAAFEGGRRAAEAERRTAQRKQQQAAGSQKSEKREGSYTNKGAMDEATDALYELEAKKLGIDIVKQQKVMAGKAEANGKVEFIDGVIRMVMSENALNPFGDNAHELTHLTEGTKGYAQYAQAVMDWYAQNKGYASAMDRVQAIQERYAQVKEGFTLEKAQQEFTAEATAGLFSTEDGAADFVSWLMNEKGYSAETKKTILQRAAELVQKIFNKIKELLKDGQLSSVARDFAEAQADEAARLRQMFLEALDELSVGEQASAADGENKFSLSALENYTDDEYNDFGWVVVHDVLNEAEYGHLTHQLSDADDLGYEYKVWNHERRVFVTDNNSRYNKLVCVNLRGKPFKIFSVIELNNNRRSKKLLEEVRLYNGSTSDAVERYNALAGQTVLIKRTYRDYPTLVQLSRQGNTGNASKGGGNFGSNGRQPQSSGKNSGTVTLQKIRKNSKWLYQPDAKTDLSDLRENPIPFVGIGEDARLNELFEEDTYQTEYRYGETVKIEDLKTLQPFVLQSGIDDYQRWDHTVIPYVIEFQGQKYLIDGNHRVVKAMMEGKKTVLADVSVRQDVDERYGTKHSLRLAEGTSNVQEAEKDARSSLDEQMDKLRLSLGLEAQNSRLTQKLGDYQQIMRQQDAEIRDLQRTLTKAGVQVFANAGRVRDTASRLLRGYGAEGIRGMDRRAVTDALEGLYNKMANEQLTRDAIETEAGEIAEGILKQSKFLTPEVSEYSRTVLDDIKSVGIRLSDAQKTEAAYRYGSYGAFYRQTFGKLKIRNDGVTLDQRWKELAEAYPNLFDAAASDADQPALLLEAVNALQNDYIDDNGFDFEEAREMLTGEILNGFRDAVAGSEKLAAGTRALLKKQHDEYEQKLARMKEQQRTWAAAAQQKAKDLVRAAKTDTAVKLRAEYDKKFLQNRARYEQRAQNIGETQLKRAARQRIERRQVQFARMLQPKRGMDNVPQALRGLVQAVVDVFPQTKMETFDREDWTTLRETYHNMLQGYEDFAGVYGEVAEQMERAMDALRELTNGKRMAQLSLRQLQNITQIMDHVGAMVKNENEMIVDGRKQKVAAVGAQVMRETKGNAQSFRTKFGEGLKNASVNNLKPDYFFARLGETFRGLFKAMEHGQDDWARSVQDGKIFLQETREKFHYNTWKDRRETVTLREGDDGESEELELTVGQMLSIYATAKREGIQVRPGEKQTYHLLGGGIVLPDQFKKQDGKWIRDDKRHNVTAEDVMAITDMLTDEQKQYADELVRYLSEDMARKGNDVTMELYGFEMFGERYYFPLNTEGAYRRQKFGSDGESMLSALGFTNATKHNAATPIIVGEFDETWANHVERMSAYSSLVVPISNMQRVWNFKQETGGLGRADTLAAEFRNAYGQKYVEYFAQFMKDINGDVVGDKRAAALTKWLTKFKKNAVFASASVTIQQPSAVCRAFVYIDPKYFAATTACNRSKMYAEAKQYTGVAIIKEMGGFDVGSGRTAVSWMLEGDKPKAPGIKGKLQAAGDKVDQIAGWPAGKADEITWAHIWAAAKKKAQVEERLSGEALNQRAAEIFTEAITMTQVYDSVFSRSANMRSQDGLMKAATAFMGEPTTSINMLEHALFYSKDKKYTAKVVTSVFLATAFNALLKSIITAGRDDDDDKNQFEKYIGQVVGNFLDDINPVNMIPIWRDVWSMLQGFSVERSELSMIQDLIDALEKLSQGKDKWSWDGVATLAGAIGPFVNLPVRNLLRDFVNLPVNTWRGFQTGNKFTAKGTAGAITEKLPVTGVLARFNIISQDSVKQMLYEAFVDGDNETYRRLAKQYKGDGGIKKALVDQIEEAYIGGRLNGEEARAQLMRLPDFDKAKANDKVRTWTNELQNALFEESGDPDGEENARSYDTLENLSAATQEARASGEESKGSWEFFDAAIASGDQAKMAEEAKRLQGLGRDKDEVDKHLRDYIKKNDQDLIRAGELYKQGDVSVMNAEATSIARRYGMDKGQVMRAIRTAAGVDNDPIEGTDWQLSDLKRAIESGSADTYDIKWAIVNAKVQKKMAEGMSEAGATDASFNSLRRSLSNYFKPKYQAADAAGRAKIREQLEASACWNKRHPLSKTIAQW